MLYRQAIEMAAIEAKRLDTSIFVYEEGEGSKIFVISSGEPPTSESRVVSIVHPEDSNPIPLTRYAMFLANQLRLGVEV